MYASFTGSNMKMQHLHAVLRKAFPSPLLQFRLRRLQGRGRNSLNFSPILASNGIGGAPSSGWDAFDEDLEEDLSFMAAFERSTRMEGDMAVSSPATITPGPSVSPSRALLHGARASAATPLTTLLRRPSAVVGPDVRKPPPPVQLFSDVDPLIEGYSTIHVSVSDPAHVATDTLNQPASESADADASSAASLSSSSSSSSALPAPLASFNMLSGRGYRYPLKLRQNMVASGLNLPTPIQQHTIPVINAGRDVLAMAYTGTGKTAAYLVPLLGALMKTQREGLPRNRIYPSALLLQPTRELVQQVYDQVRRLLRKTHVKVAMLAGGDTTVDQVFAMRGGVDLIVATPGRLLDHVVSKPSIIKLGRVRALVIDEADKMLDLGFEPELRRLVSHPSMLAAPERQTIMLSATLPDDVRRLATEFLHRPVGIQAGVRGASVHLIQQRAERMQDEVHKMERLLQLLASGSSHGCGSGAGTGGGSGGSQGGLTLVFTNTIVMSKKVHALLASSGLSVSLLHGDLPQMLRDEAMTCFKFGVTSVMVSTGLAARGVDIPDVSHVINFDVPAQADDYIHRIGRTGRAGRAGVATTLFLPQDEAAARGVVDVMLRSGHEVPQWLASLVARSGTAGRAEAAGVSSTALPEEGTKGVGVFGRLSSTPGKRATSGGGATKEAPLSPPPVAGRPPSGTRAAAASVRPLKVCDLASSRHHPFGGYLPSSSSIGRSSSSSKAAASGSHSQSSQDMLSDMPSAGHTQLLNSSSVMPKRRSNKTGVDLSDAAMVAASAVLLARWQAVIHGGRQAPPPSSSPTPANPDTKDGGDGPAWMGEDRTEAAEGLGSGSSSSVAAAGTNGGNRARTQGRREMRVEGVTTSGSRVRGS